MLDNITKAFGSVTDGIDKLVTSDEERGKLQVELKKVELEVAKLQSKVLSSEVSHGNKLQKSWRPIAMLTFLALIVIDSFGLLPKPLNPEAWTLLQIGLGGYIVGRSAEKIRFK